MWPLRTIAFLLTFLTSCGVSLYYPIVGAATYLMIYLLFPEFQWWGMPLKGLGIRYSMWAAVAMVLGMITSAWMRRVPRCYPLLASWEVLAGLLVLLAVVGYVSHEVVYTVQTVILEKFCKMMFFVFCFTQLITTRRRFMVVMWVFVVGSLLLGREAYYTPSGEFIIGRLHSIGGPDFRNSSGFAAHMAAMLPLIGATFFVTRHWILRVIPLVAGALTFNAVILCRTRSAFIALVAGAATAVPMAPRPWRWKLCLALLVVAIGAYRLTDDLFVLRMQTMRTAEQRQDDPAINLRYAVWDAGLRMVADYPMGIGIGNFANWVGRWDPDLKKRASHNTVLLCLVELGVPGMIVFALLVIVTLAQLRSTHRMADDSDDPSATRLWVYALLLSFVIYFVAGQFTERLYTESFWWVLALPTCLRRVVIREVVANEAVIDFDETVEKDLSYEAQPLLGT